MIDPKTAASRLACLKVNPRYGDSFEKHRAGLEAWHRGMEKAESAIDDAERRKGVKEAYAALHGKRHPDPDASQFWSEICNLPIERFTCPPFNVRWPDGKRVLSADEAMVFLDPQEKIDAIEEPRKNYVLSRIFAWTGIKALPIEEKDDPDNARLRVSLRLPEEDDRGDPTPGIQPHEQVLLVNTQKSRSQLIEEFEGFLDNIGKHRRKGPRVRKEWRKQLEVWDMCRGGYTFEEIAEKKGIKLTTARSRYLRALELIEGRKPIRSCEDCPKLGTNECDTCPVTKKAERAMLMASTVQGLKPMVPPVKIPPGWNSEFPPEETGLTKAQVEEIIADHKAADLGGSRSANLGQACNVGPAWTEMGGRPTWELPPSRPKKGVVLRKATKKATDPPPGE